MGKPVLFRDFAECLAVTRPSKLVNYMNNVAELRPV